jgi:hypothetical protein
VKYLVFFLFFLSLAAQATDDISVCDFYRQKSQELGCGESNYLTAFGYSYCRAFVIEDGEFSTAGKVALSTIRNCLIDSLEATPNLSCESARSAAESTHVSCYHSSGYCDLPASDKWVIFRTVWRELFDPGFLRVISRINHDCAEQRRSRRQPYPYAIPAPFPYPSAM